MLSGLTSWLGAGPRFACDLRTNSVAFFGRDDLEVGNRLVLPSSVLEELSRLNAPNPFIFKLADLDGRHQTHVGVLEFSAPEDTCYVPSWILRQLQSEVGDVLRISLAVLPRATFLRLRPSSVAFLRIFNPRALLEVGLRNYVALTVGDNIEVDYDGRRYNLEVLEAEPGGAVCILEADIKMDFASPPGSISRDADAAVNSHMALPMASRDSDSLPVGKVDLFSGSGKRPDGLLVEAGALTNDGADSSIGAAAAVANAARFGGVGRRIDGLPVEQVIEEDDSDDGMPWQRSIPKGVKWTSPPYGVELASICGESKPGVALGVAPHLLAPRSTGGLPPEVRQRVLEAAEVREAEQAEEIEMRRAQEIEKRRAEELEEKARERRRLQEEKEKKRRQQAAAAPAQQEMRSAGARGAGDGFRNGNGGTESSVEQSRCSCCWRSAKAGPPSSAAPRV